MMRETTTEERGVLPYLGKMKQSTRRQTLFLSVDVCHVSFIISFSVLSLLFCWALYIEYLRCGGGFLKS